MDLVTLMLVVIMGLPNDVDANVKSPLYQLECVNTNNCRPQEKSMMQYIKVVERHQQQRGKQ